MLVTIRPSELCGMESRLPPEYRKNSLAVAPPAQAPASASNSTTSESTIRAAEGSPSSHERFHLPRPSTPPPMRNLRREPPVPSSPPADHRRILAKMPVSSPGSTDEGLILERRRKKKKKQGMFSFLPSKDGSAKVLTKNAQVRPDFVQVTSQRASRRTVAIDHHEKIDTDREGPLGGESSPQLRGKRRTIRPSLSGLSSSNSASKPGSNVSGSQRLSISTPLSGLQDRFQSSTPALATATLSADDLSKPSQSSLRHTRLRDDRDDCSVEDSFLFDFKQSPAAAYMLEGSTQRDGAGTGYSSESERPNSSRTDRIRQRGYSKPASAAADVLATPSLTPTSAKSPVEDLSFWSPFKAAQVVVNEREASDSLETDCWPLSSLNIDIAGPLAAVQAPTTGVLAQRQPTHVHSDSRTTNSTTEAVTSPTFSTETAVNSETTPLSSMEIQRSGEGTQGGLLIPSPAQVDEEIVSIAPSEASEQWNQSPRERLGLGGNLKKVAVSPWEAEEAEHRGSRRVRRSSVIKGKPKRFSTLMGWAS